MPCGAMTHLTVLSVWLRKDLKEQVELSIIFYDYSQLDIKVQLGFLNILFIHFFNLFFVLRFSLCHASCSGTYCVSNLPDRPRIHTAPSASAS